MRTLAAVAVLMLSSCGGDVVPAVYQPDASIPDAGCVQCEGEDGAQFAESTLEWAPVTCSRTCP